MKTYTVYMHITPSNKVYIGSTCNKVEYRWSHGNGYKNSKRFYPAIQKYGWDNIQHKIVAENLSKEDAYKLERQLITQYNANDINFGYNNSIGGEISALGCVHTEEDKQKYREAKLGNKNPQYGKPSWNKGLPCKEETKLKISLANKGKTSPNKGKHLSDEQKEHLRQINLGKKYSEESKERRRRTMTLKKFNGWKKPPMSLEQRQKLSEAAKKQWAKRKEKSK